MLQGVSRTARKRHNKAAPNFLQGVTKAPRNAPSALHLKGVRLETQQCYMCIAPNFLQRVNNAARKRHPCDTLKGAITQSQQCRALIAPTSFIWCQLRIAAMPFEQRTKGRVIGTPQKCLSMGALPHQFSGDTDMTQQCLDRNPPRERPNKVRRNAIIVPPLPTSLTGAITTSQKCYKVNAPREGSSQVRSNANRFTPFPTSYRGPFA